MPAQIQALGFRQQNRLLRKCCHRKGTEHLTYVRLVAKFSEHFRGRTETGQTTGPSKNVRNSENLKWHKPIKKCTSRGDTTTNLRNFSSRIFLVRTKQIEKPILGRLGRNTINTVSGSHDNFSEKVENHDNRSELDPYSTNRGENQGF